MHGLPSESIDEAEAGSEGDAEGQASGELLHRLLAVDPMSARHGPCQSMFPIPTWLAAESVVGANGRQAVEVHCEGDGSLASGGWPVSNLAKRRRPWLVQDQPLHLLSRQASRLPVLHADDDSEEEEGGGLGSPLTQDALRRAAQQQAQPPASNGMRASASAGSLAEEAPPRSVSSRGGAGSWLWGRSGSAAGLGEGTEEASSVMSLGELGAEVVRLGMGAAQLGPHAFCHVPCSCFGGMCLNPVRCRWPHPA